MDIDSEHLGIPETDYSANIRMPSSEYARICKVKQHTCKLAAHQSAVNLSLRPATISYTRRSQSATQQDPLVSLQDTWYHSMIRSTSVG